MRLDKLLTHWIEADRPWKPSTLVGYRSVARFLTADPPAPRHHGHCPTRPSSSCWHRRNRGPGSRRQRHRRRLDVATLGHRFTRLRETAGIPDATLHWLRHSVATFLVARGEILQAQARLGHADALDRHLEQRPDHTETTQPQE